VIISRIAYRASEHTLTSSFRYNWIQSPTCVHWFCSNLQLAHLNSARHHFGNLQHKTFPIYFVISLVLTSCLLGLWTFSHPNVLTHIARPNVADVAQAYTLMTAIFCQSLNYFVIGPLTSKCVCFWEALFPLLMSSLQNDVPTYESGKGGGQDLQ
jgi:Domain of unknown function (DUF4149)